MMKLFAVLLGGRAERCNTELHDVVFVVGKTFEETYAQLVKKWFGLHKRLHVDSYVELQTVDGHHIHVKKTPPTNNDKKLFFVNFGGYRAGYFGEVHEANFYVANGKPEILAKAKKELGLSLLEPHCDDNVVVDDVISIDQVDQYYIHIEATTEIKPLKIVSAYHKLNVPEILAQSSL